MKKPNFSDKARSIIAADLRPKSLDDFLNDKPASSIPEENSGDREREKKTSQKFFREEFRLPFEIGEKLRIISFKTQKKKTQIVQEALLDYFEKLKM